MLRRSMWIVMALGGLFWIGSAGADHRGDLHLGQPGAPVETPPQAGDMQRAVEIDVPDGDGTAGPLGNLVQRHPPDDLGQRPQERAAQEHQASDDDEDALQPSAHVRGVTSKTCWAQPGTSRKSPRWSRSFPSRSYFTLGLMRSRKSQPRPARSPYGSRMKHRPGVGP